MKKSMMLIFSALVLAGCNSEEALVVTETTDSEVLISEYEEKISEYEEKISEYETIISEYEESGVVGNTVYPDEDYSESIGWSGNATPEELMETFFINGGIEKDIYAIGNFYVGSELKTDEIFEFLVEEFKGLTAEDISFEVYEGKYSEYAGDVIVNGAAIIAVEINYDSETGWVITDI